MPIRAIESVVRIRQITVARAIDWAIQEGAHVVTMSLGGIPASALHRAITPSGRGRPDRPGRRRELRAPRRLARSLRRVHRCRCDERRRPALAGHLPRCARWTSRRLARTSTTRSCPPVAPPAPIPSAKGRAPASRSPSPLESRPYGSLTTDEPTWSPLHMPEARRSRRCSAGCCRPRPADPPRGTRMRWVPGSWMRVPSSRRASTWALVAGPRSATDAPATPRRASPPWWRRLWAPAPSRRRAGLAPVRTGASRCSATATAPGPTSRKSAHQ